MSKLHLTRCTLALGCVLLCLMSMAQSPEQYVARGDKERLDGFPASALFYYQLAIQQDTMNPVGHFHAGEAHRLQRHYREAAKSYRFAAGVDERDMYPEALYWLGEMQRNMGNYEEAKKSFRHFLSIYKRRDEFYRQARTAEGSCDWALMHVNDTSLYEVSVLDSGLNTRHSEMSPFFFTPDQLYYSSMHIEQAEFSNRNNPTVKMRQAELEGGFWSDTTFFLSFEDDGKHRANGCFSKDTTRFYYSECDDQNNCQIMVKKRSGDDWSEGAPLPDPVNIDGWSSTQPALAEIGEDAYLYFVSNRGNGKGGMDIWFVPIKNGEVVPRLRNLGTRVNTSADEITPWFDASDTTFYFSSNGQTGFGGFDIFKSKGMPGSFNTVENIGPGINGPEDDYYLVIRAMDSAGYFASNRISGIKEDGASTCCNDLYRVKVLPPPVVIIPEDTVDSAELAALEDSLSKAQQVFVAPTTMEEVQDLLPISLYFHNDRPDPRSMAKVSTKTYAETIEEYLTLQTEYADAIAQAGIADSTAQKMIAFQQQFFEQDLDGSLERLDGALKVLLQELENGKDVNISVRGYASSLASSDYNLNLTYRRIDAMINYIEVYKNGAFLPFLSDTSDTRLEITKIPYGESQAGDASLEVENKEVQNIFGPNAIQERRIEILRVETGEQQP